MSNVLAGINLNRLVVFVTVVEVGSLTGAAQRLGLAKTMVSTHMQRLEAELGASLLIRTTRRLALTQAGEAFYEAARGIIQSTEDAVNAVGQDVTRLMGTLRVTAPVDYGATVITPLVIELSRKHPSLKIELLSGDRLFDLVGEGIDVAIRLGKLTDSTYRAVKLADLDSWLVGAPAVLSKIAKPTRPKDITQLPYIALSVLATPLSWTFEGPHKSRERVHFQSNFSANTAHAVRIAALAGGGITILPSFAVADDVKAGRLLHVLPEWSVPSGGVYAVFPQTRFHPQKVRVLIDELKTRISARR